MTICRSMKLAMTNIFQKIHHSVFVKVFTGTILTPASSWIPLIYNIYQCQDKNNLVIALRQLILDNLISEIVLQPTPAITFR
jgi:hypothetical protein